ncbi:pH-response regulator protein palH/RIM21 [Debaryomyces fabryi]|uniref:pH-response regulator protein palH/RIM21 n=1 Tax=Debaryomyces fabryi TaxID=58627 RepID=A0A0V1PVF8_9ASCO|nr:pH-response regulator protein palH/RIM21 [Debaryomyces fabryi]KSA00253.1 pH-response regulator protein palH/RIM21 [Debaryomyces fabryi]CUM46346.1 unnamed protein product [Debaryomyces fabryi]
MYWRLDEGPEVLYPACEQLSLPEGLLISQNSNFESQFIRRSIFQQKCYKHAVPMLNTNNGLMLNKFAGSLPIADQTWHDFTSNSSKGSFAYSVVPVLYSISILAAITWFLNIFVITNYTIKPSLLLRASTTLSSLYLLIAVIMAIVELHKQQKQGFLHGAMLFDFMNSSLTLNIIDLIVVFLLQINQVQIIMRIFLRQKDKRLTFFVGVSASITSQVLWAISRFHSFSEDSEAGDILPAFQYLVRIAMGVCYAALISVFVLMKINYIIANKKIWLITLLTVVLIYSPVAFFIADVSNAWVYELSEIFSVVTYDIGVVIPWEWCNKYNSIMKAKEKEGVLGRKFYEDELYELDRFELFVDEDGEDDEDNEDGNDANLTDSRSGNERTPEGVNDSDQSRNRNDLHRDGESAHKSYRPVHFDGNDKGFQSIYETYRRAKETFLNITDNVIAKGLGIPRSASAFTGTPISANNVEILRMDNLNHRRENSMGRGNENRENHASNDHNNTIRFVNNNGIHRTTNSSNWRDSNNLNNSTGQNRRDVFVYSTREVIIDVSDHET